EAGTARPVDFSVIDAEGSKRVDAEINDFARDYVTNIYTFTRYTVETNLRRVLDLTADEARNQVQDCVIRSKRNEALSSGYQGVCDIKSISILDAGQTSTRVQVVFVAKQIGFQAMDSSRKAVATITMKTVLRQRNNAHGLYVVEYRESDIKE
ncbi:MAG TPA: VirB8/TrbF family protein, partial [Candidatus Aminicenantes bacterium]|nr:VirB8/TrbF family protein [Candidatus Aminicenantes bacterium]